MNCLELSECISHLSNAFPKASDNEETIQLISLSDVLKQQKTTRLKTAIKKFKKQTKNLPTCRETQSPFAVVKPIRVLHTILTIAGKKTAIVAVQDLLEFLEDSNDMNIHDILSSLKNLEQGPKDPAKLISDYIEALKLSYKTPEKFDVVFNKLTSDPLIKVSEANSIANAFVGIKKKRSKKLAFEEIKNQSKYYTDASKRRTAAGGKSAA